MRIKRHRRDAQLGRGICLRDATTQSTPTSNGVVTNVACCFGERRPRTGEPASLFKGSVPHESSDN